MRLGLMAAALCAVIVSGCASSPVTSGGGLPLGRSGWEFQGGVDFQRQIYFVYFSRPFGVSESALAAGLVK
jgi:hypothetical protein